MPPQVTSIHDHIDQQKMCFKYSHRGNWFNEEKTGRIDKEGNVYKRTNPLDEEKEGRIK